MRTELAKLYFTQKYEKIEYTFIATFSKRGKTRYSKKKNTKALLTNLIYNDEIITDHVWIDIFAFKGLEKNKDYTFKATVNVYYKHNHIMDYCIENVHDIKLIKG